jgi:hypothetical protein
LVPLLVPVGACKSRGAPTGADLAKLAETQTIASLEAEITGLVASIVPQLLSEPGFGPLTAAKLVGEPPAPAVSPPTRSSPAPPGSHRSRSARGTPTARSTQRSIASPSPALAATPRPRPTSPARPPRARPTAKQSAASNATSPAASGTSSNHPRRRMRDLSINLLT